MNKIKIFLVILSLLVWPAVVQAGSGLVGGFIYLIPKAGKEIPFKNRDAILQTLKIKASNFGNDFNPTQGQTDTITYLKKKRYTLKG